MREAIKVWSDTWRLSLVRPGGHETPGNTTISNLAHHYMSTTSSRISPIPLFNADSQLDINFAPLLPGVAASSLIHDTTPPDTSLVTVVHRPHL